MDDGYGRVHAQTLSDAHGNVLQIRQVFPGKERDKNKFNLIFEDLFYLI